MLSENYSRRDFFLKILKTIFIGGFVISFLKFLRRILPANQSELTKTCSEAIAKISLDNIKPGDVKTVNFNGKPIFIYHRTKDELAELQIANYNKMIDPEADDKRTFRAHEEWLVIYGICTHLGCIPRLSKKTNVKWQCPCHGSNFDASGRVLNGPAQKNLEIPPYYFIDDNTIVIGKKNA